MSVIAFPSRAASTLHGDVPPCPAPCQVIGFPGSPTGLTPADMATLRALQRALGSGWFCETHRDPDGELWAVIGSRRGRSAGDTFLVYRQATRVVFFQLDADGQRAVGIRERAEHR